MARATGGYRSASSMASLAQSGTSALLSLFHSVTKRLNSGVIMTSCPVFVMQKPGERLGEPSLCVADAPGLQPLHESGRLEGLLSQAQRDQRMLETHLF